MMKFIYSGPPSGVTLSSGKTKTEVMLFPGREVELPEDNAYVRSLIARKHLAPVTIEPKERN